MPVVLGACNRMNGGDKKKRGRIADGTAWRLQTELQPNVAAKSPRKEEANERIKRMAARRHPGLRHISDMAGVQLRTWNGQGLLQGEENVAV